MGKNYYRTGECRTGRANRSTGEEIFMHGLYAVRAGTCRLVFERKFFLKDLQNGFRCFKKVTNNTALYQ